jgi:hypothetical protein
MIAGRFMTAAVLCACFTFSAVDSLDVNGTLDNSDY